MDFLIILRNRILNNRIYTNVGSRLIVVNPNQRVDNEVGENIIRQYMKTIEAGETNKLTPILYELVLRSIPTLLRKIIIRLRLLGKRVGIARLNQLCVLLFTWARKRLV